MQLECGTKLLYLRYICIMVVQPWPLRMIWYGHRPRFNPWLVTTFARWPSATRCLKWTCLIGWLRGYSRKILSLSLSLPSLEDFMYVWQKSSLFACFDPFPLIFDLSNLPEACVKYVWPVLILMLLDHLHLLVFLTKCFIWLAVLHLLWKIILIASQGSWGRDYGIKGCKSLHWNIWWHCRG